MPTIRESATAIINEWTLDEVSRAFDVPLAPTQTEHVVRILDAARRDAEMAKDADWYGGLSSLAQAKELLTEGWADGVRRLESLCTELNPPQAKTRVRRGMWCDQGDELNIERAMRGQWDDAWRTSRRVVTTGPATIELYSIYGGSAALTAEQVFWNGAACVVLADRLEAAGYSVRIVASFLHTDTRKNRIVRSDVIIKEAHEPLRIDGVASVLCHAGIYRSFLFRTWGAAPFELTAGLGPAVYSFTKHVTRQLRAADEWPEGAIVIDSAYDRASCVARIDEVMSKVTSA